MENVWCTSAPAEPRTELRTAHELFADFGVEAFAERASIELEATGRAHSQTEGRHAWRPDAAGSPDLAPRGRGAYE